MAGRPDGMDEMSDNRNDVTDAAARCARYATHHRSIRWWTLLDIGCLMILAWGARIPSSIPGAALFPESLWRRVPVV